MRENGAFNPYNEACALQPRKVVSDDNSEGAENELTATAAKHNYDTQASP
jgi:hypothetical protein